MRINHPQHLAMAVLWGLSLWLMPMQAFGQEPQDPASHQANGEVLHGETWVPLPQLFESYQKTLSEMDGALKESEFLRSEANELSRQLQGLRNEAEAKQRPLRATKNQAAGDIREATRALRERPPAEPRYQGLPNRPNRTRYSDRDDYNNALRQWTRECTRIKKQNDELKKEYNQRLADYTKAKADAEAKIAQAEATIADCDKQLQALESELEEAQQPILTERQTKSDALQGLSRKMQVLRERIKGMEEAMRSAPETLLWKQGIAEWEEQFLTLDALRAIHTETQTAIDEIRADREEVYELEGREFPEDWRHPQQDKMDALQSLIEKMEQAAAP